MIDYGHVVKSIYKPNISHELKTFIKHNQGADTSEEKQYFIHFIEDDINTLQFKLDKHDREFFKFCKKEDITYLEL